jgi:flagellar motor switch protein FliN/FliY
MAEEQPPFSQGNSPTNQQSSASAPADQSGNAPIGASSEVAPSADGGGTAVAEASAPAEAGTAVLDGADQASIEELLKQASFEDPSAISQEQPADAFNLPNFSQVVRDVQMSSIDMLRDVDLNVKIELGRARMMVEDVLKLSEGSVVELDKLAGDPVDVFVNDRLVARGEVLVLNDNFCVRINEIVAGVKEEGL